MTAGLGAAVLFPAMDFVDGENFLRGEGLGAGLSVVAALLRDLRETAGRDLAACASAFIPVCADRALLLVFFDFCPGATVLIAGRADCLGAVFFGGRLAADVGILALNILDFSPSARLFGEWVAVAVFGDIFEIRYSRFRNTMTAPMAIISTTRVIVIIRRSRHRFLAVELTACFASTDSGRAGNASGGGDCPSILFKALRIELKYSILQNKL